MKYISPVKIFKSVLLAYIVTILLIGIFSVFIAYLTISDKTAELVLFAIIIVSILFSSFVLSRNIERAGLLNGFLLALGYCAVLYLGSLFKDAQPTSMYASRYITLCASGALGGILGINSK